MIQSYERDFRTKGVNQHEQYFSDLSEETGSSGNQFSVCLEEEPLRQNWSPHARFMDKHQMILKELSLQLESRSQENCLPQNLSEHDMRRLTEEALMQKATLQEKLLEAEMTVSSAEMFLPTFKATVLRITNACNLSTSDVIKISKQEALLLKELEAFRYAKELLLHLLQTTDHKEVSSEHIDILMQKLVETETEIDALKKEMLERERHIQELSSQLQLEKANAQKADHLSKSVEAVQGHLQYQIKRKEMENDQLQTKIQSLEKKITEWKFQIGEYKHQILALKETSEQKKNALKKATRVQKQRAERFEAAVENLTSKIKEREVKLSEILSASSVWKSHHEKAVEEKTVLEIKTETLKKQITNLLEELENIEDHRRISNKEILGKLNSVNSETENIHLENARLKASLAVLENNTVSAEAELLVLQEKAKQQENLVEQYGTQVQKLQMEAEDLKTRYKITLNENKITEAKYLQIDKMEDSNSSLRGYSLQEENLNIQKKYEDLKRQLEKMELQNEVLAHQLANQEKSLQHNELQLKEKFTEYGALTRQLEAALEEGRKMVSEEMEKMSSKEQTLQTKILDLETELRERQEEHKQLVCKVNHSQKHHEVCLKELGHRLQKSENHNQSIQNYIKFLKSSYITMFG
ncbi:PREDICTED: outer dense fiber protein 2-like isoform X1 [Gavialis gangeticus]|uniref:outer dense fiber protein 2-like isoform X1 n=1 Tax=Gavialis gangeticus TaxID=94835 RepID=UPI00092FA004|nr:PREDICTED: outer dense fiber protein 2-like isoform X1 [Gavialis gangeticus]